MARTLTTEERNNIAKETEEHLRGNECKCFFCNNRAYYSSANVIIGYPPVPMCPQCCLGYGVAFCRCCGDMYKVVDSNARYPEQYCNWMCEANEEEWESMRSDS